MGEYLNRCQDLEIAELNARGNQLTAANYKELLLFYLVQQRLIEAKFCYFRASEKYNETVLTDLNKIRLELSKGDFGCALKKCRALSLENEFQPYVEELKNRLIAIQLELVIKCYASIEKRNLAELLGLIDSVSGEVIADEANEIFNVLLDKTKCNWTCDEASVYIMPLDSLKFSAIIDGLVQLEKFGPIQRGPRDLFGVNSNASLIDKSCVDTLKALVTCNDFFDSK